MTLFMCVCTLAVQLMSLPLVLAEALGLYRLYKRVFPLLLCKISTSYSRKMEQQKRDLFRNLPRFGPPSGPLRVLEIGCGTGANFEHFPAGCKITCTDPNPHFEQYLKKSMKLGEHLDHEKFIVASAEDLRQVQDGTVDAVVCTLVLCTIQNPDKVLQEAKRILRPGGSFFFMEHVVAEESSWIYFFQHVFQPLWYYFGDGCEMTRATWRNVEEAGFSEVQLRHIQAPLFALIKPHIVGYAVK